MNSNRYSVAKINDFYFGVDIKHLQEVCKMQKITAIPNSPSYFTGVFNLRGNVYGIIDLGVLAGVGKTEQNPESMIMLITNNHYSVGILVSKLHTIIPVTEILKENKFTQNKPELKRFISEKFHDSQVGDVFLINVKNLLASSELTIYF
ncbi:MAG: chemotaxis protein CheW [Calditrichia bacterium]|nr:chemotaxis protein CheW [Calditrichia bacterium]